MEHSVCFGCFQCCHYVYLLQSLEFLKGDLCIYLPVYQQCSQWAEENVCIQYECGALSATYEWSCVSLSGNIFQWAGAWSQMNIFPFLHLTRARQDDCFPSRVTNARTSIGSAGGRGILAVVRHLANSLIEVIHTHPSALVLSNKLGWKPAIRNCWNH